MRDFYDERNSWGTMTFSTQLLWFCFLLFPFCHLHTYLWDIAGLISHLFHRFLWSSFCFFFAKFHFDRFITSFLIQNCDSFKSLYVFSANLASFTSPYVCKSAALCCLFMFWFSSKKSEKVNIPARCLSGWKAVSVDGEWEKDLNFNILLHELHLNLSLSLSLIFKSTGGRKA